ncbi:MAG: aminotransferase class I/II-fold pyridoxal phosphate-dependent enzyme [Acidobacteriota bacterium]
MKIHSLVDTLPKYVFEEVNLLKMEARRRGDDIVDLGMGNPDLPSPQEVVDKLRQAVRNRKNHRYSMSRGIRSLRNEMALWYRRKQGVTLDPEDQVVVCLGAKEGFAHLLMALIEPGEPVLVASPCYPIHHYGIILARGKPAAVPMGDLTDFADRIRQALAATKPRPRLLVFSFPNNPTSRCVPPGLFDQIVALAKAEDLIVIHDFAYADLVYGDNAAPSFLATGGAMDVGVEFYSLSKGYSMAGWRVGFCSGNREVVSRLRRIKSYLDYGMFQPVQIAATIALRECDRYVAETLEVYRKRRDVLVTGLHRAGWPIVPPEGTIFAWAALPERFLKMGSLAFTRLLLERAHVAVSPGVGFGEGGEGFVRFALVENQQRIRQACREIRLLLA